jgi:uncharacterized protein YjbI with pentapeptide repeats
MTRGVRMRVPAMWLSFFLFSSAALLADAQTVDCRSGPFTNNQAGKNLVDHNFSADPPGSLRFTNFENADLRGAIFIGVDLTGSSFKNAKLGPSPKGSSSFNRAILDKTCFIGATLDKADFSFARFRCADFANTSLMQAEFGADQVFDPSTACRTTFVGATLDVNAITVPNWKKVDFTGAKFQNVKPETFDLRDADLTGALLAGVDLSGIDFRGANLTQADISGAKLINANFDGAALNGTKMNNRADFSFATFRCARFFGNWTTDDKVCPKQPSSSKADAAADLSQSVFRGADFTNAVLDSAVIRGATLSGAVLRGTKLRKAILEPGNTLPAASVLGADLTDSDFSGAFLNQVRFNNVVLIRAKFDGTTLSGTDFGGAVMPAARFVSATLQNVGFNGAILQGASFAKATLEKSPSNEGSGVVFTCAHLGGADFTDAKVRAADFQAAVMPPASACCVPDRGERNCGKIDLLDVNYGPVIFPVLTSPVMCPNGAIDKCSETQWQLPNWKTDLCGGGSQTVWAKPDCGAAPGDLVTFRDSKLKHCISQSLTSKPAEITKATAQKILNVSCPGLGITDLTGLEQFSKLMSLDVSGNKVEHYALKLKELRTLKIAGNGLKSLDLDKSDSLLHLDASNNLLTAIGGLTNINFTFLDVSHNQLTEVELPIQDALVFADLSYNKLTNILGPDKMPLESLKQLQYLDLSHNSLKSIGSVAPLATGNGVLRNLYLSCNTDFACNSLGITGTTTAMQKSSCAVYNSQTSQWIVQAKPECPNLRMRREKK